MRFGVNLFGVSKLFRKDPEGFLDKIRAIGYKQVEPCLTFVELPDDFKEFFWTLDELEKFSGLIRQRDLEIVSCHVILGNVTKEAPVLETIAKKYDIRQFIFGCPNDGDLMRYKSFVDDLDTIAKQLERSGVKVLIHNSYQEVLTQIEGQSAYEWVLRNSSSLIGAQVDVGWLLYAGVDPKLFLKTYEEKIHSLHYKDVYDVYTVVSPTVCNVCLGKGKVDVFSCFEFARKVGIPQIIDQDYSQGDFMSDLETSYNLLAAYSSQRGSCSSILCILDTHTCEVKELKTFNKVIEAPNWHQEDTLIYNADGLIYRYTISTGEETHIDTDFCDNCNNDHVISSDGKSLAISHSPKGSWMSQIYTLPIEGGKPKLVTSNAPSFLHGWSPDGRELAYTAFRGDDISFLNADIFTISAEGGEEIQLTVHEGMNDGPEYAPDGSEIWFNSTRSGLMQVWKMNRDGSDPIQMTFEDRNQWFPHVSPDQGKVINLAYYEGHLEPHEHLPNMSVELWLMNYDGTDRKKLISLLGGQGTINVNSWSPDSRHLAFVKYELIE